MIWDWRQKFMKDDRKVPGRWIHKIIKTVPYRDEKTGEIVPNDPPLNTKGFWDKPKTSSADYAKK